MEINGQRGERVRRACLALALHLTPKPAPAAWDGGECRVVRLQLDAAERRPDSDAWVRKGEFTDALPLRSRSRSRSVRSRSGAGEAHADVTSELEEVYPVSEKLSRLSGVVGAPGEDVA